MHTYAFKILLSYYKVNHRPRFFHYSLGTEVEKKPYKWVGYNAD